MNSAISSQFSPSNRPAYVSTKLHNAVPNVVNNKNRPKCIRVYPAGTETMLRINGISRPKKITTSP